jgi:hypothetical protein
MIRPRYAAALALVGALTMVGGGTAWACLTPSPPSGCVYQGHFEKQCPTTTTTSTTTSTTVPTTPPPTTPSTTSPPWTTVPPVPPRTVPPIKVPPTTVPPTTVSPTTVSPTTVPPVTTGPPATKGPAVTTTTAPGDCVYEGRHQQVCPTSGVADSPATLDGAQADAPAGPVASSAASAVTAADGSGQLAFTGSDIGMWVCIAGVLVLLGVALVAVPAEIAKRRR